MKGKTKIYKCKCCGDPFTARIADRARGWALYCSKSCKALQQTRRTGIGRAERPHNLGDGSFTMTPAELACGGYGDADNYSPFGDGKW